MALFGEKYGETVRTLTIAPVGTDSSATAVQPEERYSYELCGGTHLERTSDVGAFLITSEGSAAAGIRRIEAVTGRGAYELVARRFKTLKQTAGLLKASIDEVPHKVEALQDEAAGLRKELAELRRSAALATFSAQLDNVQNVNDVKVLAMEVPNANVETLRSLADKFRERHPQNSAAVLVTGGIVIAVLTEDLVKKGMKAGDLITAIGGRGGGRPNMAQGSLQNGFKVEEMLEKVSRAFEEKLK